MTKLRIGYDGVAQAHIFVLIFYETFVIKLADIGDDDMGPSLGKAMSRLTAKGKIKVPGIVEINMDEEAFDLLSQLHEGVKKA